MNEILTAARRQLRTGDDYSIRSVATEIGLSSQGLYRYVDSIDQLRGMVTKQILDSILGYMGAARDRYQDPVSRIVASAVAFRTWALANHAEFRHAFTNSETIPLPDDPAPLNTPQRVGQYFAPLFAELREQTGFSVPDAVDEIYRQTKSDTTDAYTTLAGEEQIGLIWVFQYAWTRLYGIVVLEVFKQIEQETIDSGMFFRLTLSEIAERLGIKDTDQLDAIFTAESKR